jgi:hypothetical protein
MDVSHLTRMECDNCMLTDKHETTHRKLNIIANGVYGQFKAEVDVLEFKEQERWEDFELNDENDQSEQLISYLFLRVILFPFSPNILIQNRHGHW